MEGTKQRIALGLCNNTLYFFETRLKRRYALRSRITSTYCLFLLIMSFLLPATIPAYAGSPEPGHQRHALADFPTVDPNYIYDQLFYMATNFQHREAGYDNNLPANINGHDEFASYWSQEMVKNLAGFGPQIRIDKFPVQGWQNRPAILPAFNVEVSVPGVTHPEQVVVIGCHYDGMAISTQSANDDASGCAIELGVARAMGDYWRTNHTYPARTLRFVIFDAEEQGVLGSFHYLNSTVNGDTRNIVAMFNEEQSGIAYPVRYLGRLANPLLPFYIYLTPLDNSDLYPAQEQLSPERRASIVNFRALIQQAIPAVFQQFQASGYQELTYHSDNNPPAWSYPYDQRQDTIQLMNTFALGGSHKSNALALALALPGMFTTWMLNQPSILGQSTVSGHLSETPIAAISDIGQTRIGQALTLNARTAFSHTGSSKNFTYSWNFGDGTQAKGIEVSHAYTSTGAYTLTLTVSAPGGTQRVSKILDVTQRSISYHNIHGRNPGSGNPPSNPQVHLPTPDDRLQDRVITSTSATATKPPVATPARSPLALLIGGVVILMFL